MRRVLELLASFAFFGLLNQLVPSPAEAASWSIHSGAGADERWNPRLRAWCWPTASTCSPATGRGSYRLNVPLDALGQVTLFAFADGFAPYRMTAAPAGLPSVLQTVMAAPGSPLISTTREALCTADGWVRVSGEVESLGGAPLCALVLANGQHMFSCGASLGWYDLTVPTDERDRLPSSPLPMAFSLIGRVSRWIVRAPTPKGGRIFSTACQAAAATSRSFGLNLGIVKAGAYSLLGADYSNAFSPGQLYQCLSRFLPARIAFEPRDTYEQRVEAIQRRIEACEDLYLVIPTPPPRRRPAGLAASIAMFWRIALRAGIA